MLQLKELFEAIWAKADRASNAAEEYKFEDVTLQDLPFRRQGKQLVEARSPDYPLITVHTLEGLIQAVKSGRSKPVEGGHIRIVDPVCVKIEGDSFGAWKQRQTFLQAKADVPTPFGFGNWWDADQFLISLQTSFLPTPDRDALMRTLGNIQTGGIRTSTDDGISQTVSVRAGVTLVGEAQVKNPISLKPYRTFFDVDQPASPFVVRLKQEKDQLPKVALFEADGGLWRQAATQAIMEKLVAAELGMPVLR